MALGHVLRKLLLTFGQRRAPYHMWQLTRHIFQCLVIFAKNSTRERATSGSDRVRCNLTTKSERALSYRFRLARMKMSRGGEWNAIRWRERHRMLISNVYRPHTINRLAPGSLVSCNRIRCRHEEFSLLLGCIQSSSSEEFFGDFLPSLPLISFCCAICFLLTT